MYACNIARTLCAITLWNLSILSAHAHAIPFLDLSRRTKNAVHSIPACFFLVQQSSLLSHSPPLSTPHRLRSNLDLTKRSQAVELSEALMEANILVPVNTPGRRRTHKRFADSRLLFGVDYDVLGHEWAGIRQRMMQQLRRSSSW